jgi:hypothetical protein
MASTHDIGVHQPENKVGGVPVSNSEPRFEEDGSGIRSEETECSSTHARSAFLKI